MTPWSIVVIDDSSRFPLHVWRYASRCLGFGIGEVEADGCRPDPSGAGEMWIRQGATDPLVTDDARLRLWWVVPDNDWRRKLEEIFNRPERHGRVFALVDVYGKPGSSFSAEEACRHLEAKDGMGVKVIAWMVSAYHSGHRTAVAGKTRAIRPKSRETLRLMMQQLELDSPGPIHLGNAGHILVSGAGFEIRDARGGFGMPATRELLQGMGEPFWYVERKGAHSPSEELIILEPARASRAAASQSAFPVPRNGVWQHDFVINEELYELANKMDLDGYWDVLLEEELRARFSSAHHGGLVSVRARRKARALWHERRLRQAFRHSLLQHDWGFMNQSLDAARLPLHAWLTTNYTHFANRAISLYGDANQDRLGGWRIVATAAGGRPLAREDVDLEPDEPDMAAAPPRNVDAAGKARYLFKLHGDIAHLQTMAIAGHDKAVFSPLSMPIEDLYEVYVAAERFLLNSLRPPDRGFVVWHLVGHGLLDKRLCKLLGRVARQLAVPQVFVVVNPDPDKPRERLMKALGGSSHTTYTCKLTAGKYMARLYRLLRDDAQAKEVLAAEEPFDRWLRAAQCGFEAEPAAASLY